MNRGEIWDVERPGTGRRPAVVVTRQVAIALLTRVTVVYITSTIRELPTEVPLGKAHGLDNDCVANCDTLGTVPKRALTRRRGQLGPSELGRLDAALRIALQLD